MDFLDPKKKRAHARRLFIGYALVGVALFIATFILLFEASGYDVDRKTGQVIQNGLVFIDAQPESADIYLNGQAKGNTDNRLVIPAGEYKLELKRKGYRTWSHIFSLDGGSIERFIYPFLFPENITSNALQQYSSLPVFTTQSPDRRWLLVQQPGQLASFDTFNLDNDKDKLSSFSIPDTILKAGPGVNKLELVEWSTDNRRALVKHTSDAGAEFIVIDRDTPSASLNINATFPTEKFTDVRLRDKKFDQYYLYNKEGGILKSVDLGNRQVTPLLTNVLAFQPHGADILLYATDSPKSDGKVTVNFRDGQDTFKVRDLPVSSLYLLNLAQFDGHWYFAIGAQVDSKVYIYKDGPQDLKSNGTTAPILLLQTPNPQYVTFSANARNIMVQGAGYFGVYDAENNRIFQYNSGLADLAGYKAEWMDGHRIMVVSGGKLVVWDFDNTNRQTLLDIAPGTAPRFNRDYTAVYVLSTIRDAAKPDLLRGELKVKQ